MRQITTNYAKQITARKRQITMNEGRPVLRSFSGGGRSYDHERQGGENSM
jgi:hypothetical protein